MNTTFTDPANCVMRFANQEAQRFNQDHVGTEHILLGLMKTNGCLADRALMNQEVYLLALRTEIEKLKPVESSAEVSIDARLPLTTRAADAVHRRAPYEAVDLQKEHIGTGLLLLGITGDDVESVATTVLLNCGVDVDALRDEVIELVRSEDDEPVTDSASSESDEEVEAGDNAQMHRITADTQELLDEAILKWFNGPGRYMDILMNRSGNADGRHTETIFYVPAED